MLTYPWKCTVLHCNHLGNTWKPLVLMTRHFDYCLSASEGDNQSVRSSAPVVSRCFPGGYNVKLYISRGRLAWCLLAFLHSVFQAITFLPVLVFQWNLAWLFLIPRVYKWMSEWLHKVYIVVAAQHYRQTCEVTRHRHRGVSQPDRSQRGGQSRCVPALWQCTQDHIRRGMGRYTAQSK